MSVRPHPCKGPGWWYIDVGYGKNRQRYPFQGTKADALIIEEDLRRRALPGPPAANPRVDEIAGDYLDEYQTHHLPAGTERQRRSMAIIIRFFGPYKLNSITPALIERYKRQRIDDGVKPTTIQKELTALGSLLKWAADQGIIETALRIKRFPAKMIEAPLPRVPTAEEVEAILSYIPHHKRPIISLMYWCGLRSSEARNLTADQVSKGRRMLIIKGKGGKQRTIPVPDDELWRQIEIAVNERPDGPLWPNPETGAAYKDLRGTLEAAAKKAGYGKITPHKFRHAYCTELIASGAATLRDVQILAGHSTSRTTELYTHLSTERLTAVTSWLKRKDEKKI